MGITAAAFAQRAVELAGLNPPIPYVLGGRTRAGTDCSNLIRLILRELGGKDIAANSNAMWSSHVVAGTRLFIHDPKTYLVPGALLWIDYNSPVNRAPAGTPGKMNHMGIYVGNVPGLIAANGKQGNVIHASQSVRRHYADKGEVCASTLQNAWTHGAWLNGIDYSAPGGGIVLPGIPPATQPPVTQPPIVAPLASAEPGPGQAKVVTTTSGLYLRKLPGKEGARIKEMPIGTIVTVLRVEGEWAQVRWDVRPGLHHIGWACVGENGTPYMQFGGD